MDQRTLIERQLDRVIGLPLYYCGGCYRPARVINGEVIRHCSCTGMVHAPRIAILHGENDPMWKYRVRVWWMQTLARLTQRCVGFHEHVPLEGNMSAGISGSASFGTGASL